VRSAFESAFTQAPIGMALVDMTGRLLRVNDALCRITGYTADEVCARSFRDLSDPDDDDVDAQQIVDLIEGRTRRYQIEKRYRHASGHPVWVLVIVSLVRDDEDRPLHLIAQVQDITHRKELEGRLGQLVDHDFLTTLFNSRRFEQALAQEIKSAARYGGGGALLLLDLEFQSRQRSLRAQSRRRPAQDGRRGASESDPRDRCPGAPGRLRSRLWRESHGPARRRGDRGDREGHEEKNRSGIRHRSRHVGSAPAQWYRLRAGLSHRHAQTYRRDVCARTRSSFLHSAICHAHVESVADRSPCHTQTDRSPSSG
jgi:PAS domain S-box-containing protein